MRYDAAIIGAGADGLAAAAALAKSGFKTIVLERGERAGGRCVTREFHPGFRATPFCDEVAPIPADVFWSLDLGRRGAIFTPSPVSTALWSDRANVLRHDDPFLAKSGTLTRAVLARAAIDAAPKHRSLPFVGRPHADQPWPCSDWVTASLCDALASRIDFRSGNAEHLVARALAGRAAHPAHSGSALHLLAPGIGGSGLNVGGLQRLADGLVGSARDAGAEISCGLEVADICRASGGVRGVRLADGTEIAARSVISTLDLKRTFLSLFAWNDLPPELARRVAVFRIAGSTARLLFALDGLPDMPSFSNREILQGPIHVAPSSKDFAEGYAAWRAGTIPERPQVTLRFPSATDPGLCRPGDAVMTATVGCIPMRLFDGSWTHERRDTLRDRVIGVAEGVLPGLSAHILAVETITPPDIEDALGLTDGDLWGGEIAADQMMGLRPDLSGVGPRTPITGVYLAGPSSAAGPIGTCASGAIAARAVIADFKTGRLK